MSTAVAPLKAHLGKCKMDFDAVVAFLTQYTDKIAPRSSVKVAFVSQTRPAKQQKISTSDDTFKEMIELKKYSREEYDLISIAECQQLYELQKKADFLVLERPQKAAKL